MNKKIVRVPIDSIGDVNGYSMIEYHMAFTETINKLLKSNNINFKLQSMSYGGEYCDSDCRILFKLEENKLWLPKKTLETGLEIVAIL